MTPEERAEVPDVSAARYSPEELSRLLGQHAPTEEQSAVITAPLQPRLVVAGAGSGKTATMSDRVVWLVANGFVAPDQVLGVTFTRKAAGELAQRINHKLDLLVEAGLDLPLEPDARASVSTYHSYAHTLVRDHGMRIGLEPDTGMVGEAQSYQIMSRVVRDHVGDLDFADIAASSLVAGALKLAGDCAEHLVEPDRVGEYLAEQSRLGESLPYDVKRAEGSHAHVSQMFRMLRLRGVMAELVASYREATQAAGVMDYGDLVRFAARIAREVPVVGQVERSRYRVVLLDEFQDTSHAQLELFRGLYGTGGHPVTAVGDPHQSIYGFRGASAGQLFAFPGQFSVPTPRGPEPAPVSHLTTAWRNSHAILAAANTVAGPLRGASDGAIRVKPLTASPVAVDGEVRAAWLPDSEQEAAAVVRVLKEAGGDGRAAAERPTRAILCRTRSQFEPLMEAMDLAGMPYEVLGLSGLLSVPEVADVIAVLQVISDPGRSDHLMRLLTGARWRIGAADLVVLQGWASSLARNRTRSRVATPDETDAEDAAEQDTSPEEAAESSSLVEALDRLPEPGWTDAAGRGFSTVGRERLERLGRELRYLSGQTGLELTALIRLVETTVGLDIEVAARPGQTGAHARRHLDGFLDAARDFSRGSAEGTGADLTAFLGWLQAAEEREKGLGMTGAEPSHDAVQLLTAHASKGLEWDIVAVPGLVEGQFPGKTVDTWTSEKAGHLPWPLRGDAASLPQWDTGWDNQRDWAGHALGWTLKRQKEDYPDSYRDRAAAHQLGEERRLAYVAFTRARRLLLLSGSHWRGSTKTPATPSPFLTEVMEAGDGPVVVAEPWATPETAGAENPFAQRKLVAWWPFDPLDGPDVFHMDPQAPDDLERATALPRRSRPRREDLEAAARWVRAAAQQPASDEGGGADDLMRQVDWVIERSKPVNHRGSRVELPGHVSASTFVALADDPAAVARQLRRPMPRPPAHAARRGTAFHAWVEDHFGATGMLDFDDPEDSADHWVEDALDLGPMKERFLASRWADRVPAAIEPPVETTVGGVTLRGRIDAVFREGGDPDVPHDPEARWELVDWKTGAVPTGRDLEVKSLQLAVYRLAWSRLHGIPLENISASFVYVMHGVEESRHDLAGAQGLEDILAASIGSA